MLTVIASKNLSTRFVLKLLFTGQDRMLKLCWTHRFSMSTGSVDSFLTLTSVIVHEKGITWGESQMSTIIVIIHSYIHLKLKWNAVNVSLHSSCLAVGGESLQAAGLPDCAR